MAFLSGTAFAADFFRVSYQSAEAAFNDWPIAPELGELDRLGRSFKIVIAAIDAIFTMAHYTGIRSEVDKDFIIVPLRLAAIVQGLYQLLNDLNADRESIQRSIFLNTLNIGSCAMRILKQGTANSSVQTYLDYASLACTLSDALYRVSLTYSQRTAIANKLSAIYQGIDVEQLAAAAILNISNKLSDLYQGIDLKQMAAAAAQKVMNVASTIDQYAGYPLRIFVTALIVNNLLGMGLVSLEMATKADPEFIFSSILIAGLGCGLVKLTQKAVHKIFDDIGIPQNKIRQIAEWSFSLIVGGTFTAAAAKGMGVVQSFSTMLKTAYPTVLMAAVFSSLFLISIIGGEELGFEPGTVKGEIWTIIANFSLMFLSEASAIGFGLASTKEEAHNLLFSTIAIFTSIFSIWLATTTAGKALFSGVPSWEELGNFSVISVGSALVLMGSRWVLI